MRFVYLLLSALPAIVACDPTPPTFAALNETVFSPRCANAACHDDDRPERGLDLLTDPYTAMVGVETTSDPARVYVAAGDSANSVILEVLKGPIAQGDIRQMPVGFELDEETIRGIELWIDAGAPDDG
jgi:hypothetical protein